MKPVVGYEEYFSVTKDGKIYSHRSNKFLKQTTTKTGYLTVSSRIGGRNGKAILIRVHRAVAEAFIPNPYDKPFVNHIDCNKKNNNVNNLEWCTAKENVRHAEDNGLLYHVSGMLHASSKLTEEDIKYIRATYIPYSRSNGTRALGKMFNVDHVTIHHILHCDTWKHIS